MGNRELKSIREAMQRGRPISEDMGLYVLRSAAADPPRVFASASTVRQRCFGGSAGLCSIYGAGRVRPGDLQSMIFNAGADSMMTGPLLTTAGRNVEQDIRMLRDLKVKYAL